MVANPFRIKVIRAAWNPPPAGAQGSWPWSSHFIRAILQGENGASVREYWRRASFGIVNIEFDLSDVSTIPFSLAGLDATALSADRDRAISAIQDRARAEGMAVDGFDGLIALVNPPPSDAGAWGNRALFDQAGYMEFFQHEVGHVIGLDHAFGWTGGPSSLPYRDDWCVMGFTGPQSWTLQSVPSEATGVVTPLPGNFWQMGRRVSTANLFRTFHADMERWVKRASVDEVVVIGGSANVAALGSPVVPVLAVVPLPRSVAPRHPNPHVLVEYRTQVVDDRAVRHAVVVHSFGLRHLDPPVFGPDGRLVSGYTEVDPVVFEGEISPVSGQTLTFGRVTVTIRGTDFPGFLLGPRPPVVQLVVTETS